MTWLILMMVLGDPGWGIVKTKAGSVYAADVIRNVVWKVDANGRASGFVEDAEAWWILEHIPMREFEGIHTRKEPYLQVRRFDKRTGVGVVLLRVSRSAP